MKNINVYKILFTSALFLPMTSALAEGEGVFLKRNVYTVTSYYSVPLKTSDSCSEAKVGGNEATETGSGGKVAAEWALDEAMDQCEADHNVDCVHVSTKVWPKVSLEFIGYKRCAARVRVHGYEVR